MKAASVLGDSQASLIDLANATLAAQLRDQLVDLSQSGRTDRVTLAFEPTRRVDWDPSAQLRFALLGCQTAFPNMAQPKVFSLDHLADCGRIVDLRYRNVGRPNTSPFVRTLGREPGQVMLDIVWNTIGTTRENAGSDRDRAARAEAMQC